jgi:hypothetical protein
LLISIALVDWRFCRKGFEHHARDKVKGLIQKGLDDLLCTNKVYRQYHYEDRNMDALSQVVENYMFEGLKKGNRFVFVSNLGAARIAQEALFQHV